MEALLPLILPNAEVAAGERLLACNRITARYGLTLSPETISVLLEGRRTALARTGRVEFGGGVLEKLVYAFCDSPYVSQADYGETLLTLQDLFYHFKNESADRLSDDELIEAMARTFDERAGGSLEYLAGTALEELCRGLRTPAAEEAVEEEKEDG